MVNRFSKFQLFGGLLLLLIIIIVIIFLIRFPTDRQSLKIYFQAGANFPELLKTFDHFRKDANPRKLEAAKYIIRNMDLHYFKKDSFSKRKVLWAANNVAMGSEELHQLDTALTRTWNELLVESQVEKVRDCREIQSKMLIQHIEETFEIWSKSPWQDHYDFHQFCDLFLSYKTNLSKPESWITDYRKEYQWILDNLDDPDLDAVIQYSYNSLKPRFRSHFLDIRRHMSPIELNESLVGDCVGFSDWICHVTRSLGMPVVKIYNLNWANSWGSHYWNAWLDTTGQWQEIMPGGGSILEWGNTTPKISVIHWGRQESNFRFAADKHGLSLEDIPPLLQPWNISDVTQDLIPTSDVTLNVYPQKDESNPFIFLGVQDDRTWDPVHWTKVDHGKAYFQSIGRNILYLPVYYSNKKSIPAGAPIILSHKGEIRYVIPDTNEVLLPLYRVFPIKGHVLNKYGRKMLNSAFEGSNDNEFKSSEVLFQIQDIPLPQPTINTGLKDVKTYDLWWQEFQTLDNKSYQYIRFKASDSSYCTIGEMEIYDPDGRKLQFKNIFGSASNMKNISDGIPGEHVKLQSPGTWVAMDLGQPMQIGKIRFIPQDVEPASIMVGDEYLLSIWRNDTWIPVMKETAKKKVIEAKIHPFGMYLLEDLSRKVYSRPFIFNPDTQILEWW